MACGDFCVFHNVKMITQAICLESVQDIQTAATVQAKVLMKVDFLHGFKKWQECGLSVLEVKGSTFKGNS